MNSKKLFRIISIGQLNDIPSRLYDLVTMIAVALTISLSIADTFEIG